MKILVDENIPNMTVKALRQIGHDVLDIRGTAREGADDEILWDIAQEEWRLLITTDKGFAQRRYLSHPGILIIRLRKPNRLKIHARVMQAIDQVPVEEWNGLVLVMRDFVQSDWRLTSD